LEEQRLRSAVIGGGTARRITDPRGQRAIADVAGVPDLVGVPDVVDGPDVPAGRRGAPVVDRGYVAGFDGLRALGLLVMLAYHQGMPAARGGIFTVSMFFTLSGYLIATLALGEWARTGRLALGRFWERRARRLLPAALVTVAGVVVLQALFEVGSSGRFRGDLLAALGYVANWRFAGESGGYGALFETESPVQHFWSLAVEEQFYLTFPLLFTGLLAVAGGRWRKVGAVFCGATVATFALAWWSAGRYGNDGLTYYATWTRASEVLAGVTLAFVVARPSVRSMLASAFGRRSARIGGLVGLAGLLWLWGSVGLTNTAVFRGATALNALFTCLVILACRPLSRAEAATGVVPLALGSWPLRNLGKISYGVYLFHWPLFLLLDEQRTGLSGQPLFALRLVVTIGLAVGSYHLLEAPFRFGFEDAPRRLTAVLVAPAVVLVGAVLVVPVHRSGLIEMPATAAEDGDPFKQGVVEPSSGAVAQADVLLVGDSVSWTMWPGLADWNDLHPDQQIRVDGVMALGCTLATPGTSRFLGEETYVYPDCEAFRSRLARALAEHRYDVVVVQMGHKDLGERMVAGEWRHLGDPAFDSWMADEVAGFADILAAGGRPVLWATLTHVDYQPDGPGSGGPSVPENDPDRVDRLNGIVAQEIATRPHFATLDTAGWLRHQPGGEIASVHRLDGIHWTFPGSTAVATFAVPHILTAAHR
jgi:peptidoglycan/LPS O-acetylase OafA/YrhL